MASVFSHAGFAIALGAVFPRARLPRWAWLLGTICSVAPDLDVIGFWYGIPYGHVLGHRGITHSLFFAAVLSVVLVLLIGSIRPRGFSLGALLAYLFICTASHGVFDALTNGGLGIAFFAPFLNERYFFAWQPIQVSPIGVGAFFSEWGLRVIVSELVWIGLPTLVLAGSVLIWRRYRRSEIVFWHR